MELKKSYKIDNLCLTIVIPEEGEPSMKVRGGTPVTLKDGDAKVGLNHDIELTEAQKATLIALRDEVITVHSDSILNKVEKDVAITIAAG